MQRPQRAGGGGGGGGGNLVPRAFPREGKNPGNEVAGEEGTQD